MNCPICHEPLHQTGKTFQCKNHHSFDQARQGYVNLSRKQKASGDNAEMVRARTAFLETGLYDFLRQSLVEQIESLHPKSLLDLGCGQGYYTRTFGAAGREVYGIDLSVPAVSWAAGQDKGTRYIVGSIYDLPFENGSFDLLTSIFTPIPAKEAARVLKPEGRLITVTPGKMHHYELKEVLYPSVRLNDELESLEGFTLENQEHLTCRQHVKDVRSLLDMTPYRYKTSREGLEKIENLKEGLDVTFDFIISTWRKNV